MKFNIKKQTLIQVLPLVLIFFFLYYKAIAKLISDWSIDPNFSHGFLIPFVALYMVWYKKNEISQIPHESSKTGIIIIILGMLIHIAGNVGSELFLMRFSMIITLSGIIMYYYGVKMFRELMVPVAYLIMMIPIPSIIWNKIAFPLQLFSANLSSHTISLLNIPVFREGNILHLANTSLEVIDACSGIRSLTSLLALTGVFAFLAPLGLFKKWILFFSAIPIAVAVNVIRLTITGAMAAWISPETAHGFLHDMSGLIIFGAALILVYIVFAIEMKIEKTKR
ncbi:MAG: exosortase/archaeosortase family protein [Proteobacteria bacterium]|nr:exosortase/archaeosortase family protein [Pseudomonadota bacterium]MBU1582689.1 exosortase/archaeosortase family protein [Pseudomonadota bacterium]MBU2455078.1 exosortase/archaeosortase family protein [Pseudomonadota bacterium]MBU2629000.1 exosortase/archaeosortase family protein [Pseudomonadota bacterium]